MNGFFRLKIEMGNDTMQTPSDLAQALREMAAKVESEDITESREGKVLDDNGLAVGSWKYHDEDVEDDDDYE